MDLIHHSFSGRLCRYLHCLIQSFHKLVKLWFQHSHCNIYRFAGNLLVYLFMDQFYHFLPYDRNKFQSDAVLPKCTCKQCISSLLAQKNSQKAAYPHNYSNFFTLIHSKNTSHCRGRHMKPVGYRNISQYRFIHRCTTDHQYPGTPQHIL